MRESFNFVVCTIEESRDLDTMTVDELQSTLLIHEQKIRRKVNDEQVLKVECDRSIGRGRGQGSGNSNRGRGHGRERAQGENKPQLISLRLNVINAISWDTLNMNVQMMTDK